MALKNFLTIMSELESLKKQLEEEKKARIALEEEVQALRQDEAREALVDEVKELHRKNKVLMMQMEELFRKLESEGEGHVNMLVKKIIEEKKDKEKLANEYESEEENLTNSLLLKLKEAEREKEGREKELEDLKAKIEKMAKEKERLALDWEQEEDAMANKLRTIQKEKEAVEIALSRSSRSSSISETNSSICVEEGGSVLSGGGATGSGPATRDEDARSEMSFMSNLASASESESQYDGNHPPRKILPPPPIHVGGVLPVVIGEED